MSSHERVTALEDLLAGRVPPEEAKAALSACGWDSDADLVTVLPEHVLSVLDRVADGSLRPADAQAWADAIEGREDIGFVEEARDVLEEAIFALANPELTEPLDDAAIKRWTRRLRAARVSGRAGR